MALALSTCTDNPTAPNRPGPGLLRVVPVFPANARSVGLVFDNVHLVVARPARPIPPVLDKTYNFPPTSPQLNLSEQLLLQSTSEDFDVTLEYRSGTIVLFAGTSRVTVHQGPPGSNPPPQIPLTLQVGSTVAAITLTPKTSVVPFGGSVTFSVAAQDGQGAPVTQFYVSWSTSDPQQTVDGAGKFTAGNQRDTVTITATTPNAGGSVTDQATVIVMPAPSQLVKTAGDAQSAPAGSHLPQVLEVEVRGSDNLPIPGIAVTFAAATGGGTPDIANTTSDQNGRAGTGVTLGSTQGLQTFTASTGGITATFSETATGIVPTPVLIAAGGDHSCEIRSGGSVFCWGSNGSGELGDGSTTNRLVATAVSGGGTFTSLALGTNHSCALTAAGQAFCWGNNSSGALGDGTNTSRTSPTAVTGGRLFVQLAAGNGFTCGLTSAGQAFCWGDNSVGQVGDGSTSPRNSPTAVSGGHSFTTITAGGSHACAIDLAAQAFCWGLNSNGELGDGGLNNNPAPVAVTGGLSFSEISVGNRTSCALDTSGAGFCWGFNFGAQLTTPTPVGGGFTYTGLDMGGDHVCGLTAAGVRCGGRNASGQLGDGTQIDRPTPVQPLGGFTFTAIAGGDSHTCGLTATGRLCWGANNAGQLGDGTTTQHLTPAPVLGPPATVSINAGNNQTAAPDATVAIPPSVLVEDAQGNPLQGVQVDFAVATGGGGLTGGSTLTDASGVATVGSWNMGPSPGANTLTATVAASGVAGNPITFSATAGTGGAIVWDGSSSASWTTAANWTPAQVPTTNDDVLIPAGTPNNPVISSTANVRSLTIATGTTLTLAGSFSLQIAGDVDATGGIFVSTGTPTVQLTGSGRTLQGIIPNASITGTISLAGVTVVTGNLAISGGTALLTMNGQSASVGGNFSTGSGGRIDMTNPTDVLVVTGAVAFGGGSEVGLLTNGSLSVGGNFTQTGSGSANSFAASGSHATGFVGTAVQTVNFQNPGPSAFNILTLVPGSVGLSLATNIAANAELATAAPGTPPTITGAGHTVTVSGLAVAGLVLDNAPLVSVGGSISGFSQVTFQNFSPTVTQLTVTHPGVSGSFTFDQLTFSTTPTSGGFYISAQDQNPADGIPLTIDMTSPTPATGAPFIQTVSGAVVNWPSGAPTTITWTGGVSSDWSVAGNWSPAQVPGSADSVVIVAATNHPVLSANASAGSVNMTGSTLTLNGNTLTVARGFTTSGTATLLILQNSTDLLTIGGDAVFDGGNELNSMSAGRLTVGGNLTQLATNSADSYHPSGTHITFLTGASPTVTFATPGIVPGSSHFQVLSWTGGGILTLGSDVFAHGAFSGFTGSISSAGKTLSVGDLTWGGTVPISNTQLVIDQPAGLPINLSNITFQSMSATATQLAVNHPGTGGPFTLTNVVFDGTPTTGFYLRANDTDGPSPTVLTLDVVNPTPATPGTFVQTVGGAVVNWPAIGAITWTGATSTTYTLAANWSPAQVPTAADNVLIPSGTPNSPQLVGTQAVNDLTIASGAQLAVNINSNLTINGNASVPGLITAGANVTLTLAGAGKTVSGNFPILTIAGSYTQDANLAVTGDLSIAGAGATLDNGGFVANVGGNFSTATGGVLIQTVATDNLVVTGSVTFDGASETGKLTHGQISTAGNFAQLSSSSTSSFVGTQTHVTVLAGTVGQTINFASPLSSQFASLVIGSTGASGVFLASRATAGGQVTIAGNGRLTLSGRTLLVSGSFQTSNSGLLVMTAPLDSLLVGGNVTFDGASSTGQLTNGVIVMAGSFIQAATTNTQSFSASGAHKVVFNSITPSMNMSNPGAATSHFQDLDVSSAGTLTLNTFVEISGRLISQPISTTPTLTASATLAITAGSADIDGLIVNDVELHLGGGTITQLDNVTFQGFAGNAIQLQVDHPGAATPFTFNSLTFNSTPTTGFYISANDTDGPSPNTLTIDLVNAVPATPGTFVKVINGAVVTWNGVTPTPTWTGSVSTDWSNAGNWSSGSVPTASDSVVIPTAANQPTLTGTVSVGAVNVSGGKLTLGGQSMTVAGTFTTTASGTLVMGNADGLTVQGDAVFDGGDETGLLTSGVLSVAGNFTQANTTSKQSFKADLGHSTVLNGTAAQTLIFADSILSSFGDLSIANSAGVVSASVPTVLGKLDLTSGTTLSATDLTLNGTGMNVFGTLTLPGGSTLTLGRLYMAGSINIGGTYNVTSTILTGTGQTANASLPYQNLFTSGTVTFGAGSPTIGTLLSVAGGTLTLSGTTTVTGQAQATGGSLIVNGQTLTVNGTFVTATGGTLSMKNAADLVTVSGGANFSGGDENGLLAAGTLAIQGSFNQSATSSPLSFAASGSHLTKVFTGSMFFETPGTGATGSHFNSLDVTGATSGVTLSSPVIVDSALIAAVGAGAPKLFGGGNSLTAKQFQVNGFTLDNLPLVLDEQGVGRPELLNGVTFQNFPTTATSDVLLDVTGPGTALAPRTIQFNNTTVQTTLGSGGLYVQLVSSNGQGLTLTMQTSNDPTGGPSRSNPPFGTTVAGARIVWQ